MSLSMRACVVALFAFSAFAVSPVPCKADDLAELQTLLSPYGGSVEMKSTGGVPTYEFSLNKREFMATVPILQKLHMLNPDMTPTYINLHPVTLSVVTAQEMSVVVLQKLYSGDSNHVRIVAFLMEPDDFGHLQEHEMFHFSFTKSLFQKIDWDNFEMTKFSKVAPGFAFSDWALSTVSSETN